MLASIFGKLLTPADPLFMFCSFGMLVFFKTGLSRPG